MSDRDRAYEAEIKPLVQRLVELCRAYDIASFMSFQGEDIENARRVRCHGHVCGVAIHREYFLREETDPVSIMLPTTPTRRPRDQNMHDATEAMARFRSHSKLPEKHCSACGNALRGIYAGVLTRRKTHPVPADWQAKADAEGGTVTCTEYPNVCSLLCLKVVQATWSRHPDAAGMLERRQKHQQHTYGIEIDGDWVHFGAWKAVLPDRPSPNQTEVPAMNDETMNGSDALKLVMERNARVSRREWDAELDAGDATWVGALSVGAFGMKSEALAFCRGRAPDASMETNLYLPAIYRARTGPGHSASGAPFLAGNVDFGWSPSIDDIIATDWYVLAEETAK